MFIWIALCGSSLNRCNPKIFLEVEREYDFLDYFYPHYFPALFSLSEYFESPSTKEEDLVQTLSDGIHQHIIRWKYQDVFPANDIDMRSLKESVLDPMSSAYSAVLRPFLS
jgi:hypothetical protein